MKKFIKYFMISIGVIALAWLFVNLEGNIGSPKWYVEKNARKYIEHTSNIKDSSSLHVNKTTTETMYALIFYDESKDTYFRFIYMNDPGLSFGYSLKYRSEHNLEKNNQDPLDSGITKYYFENRPESIYFSLNEEHLGSVLVSDNDGTNLISLNSNQPFVLLLPEKEKIIDCFDDNGSSVLVNLQCNEFSALMS